MNRKQRRHPGKVQGLSYADRLSRQRAVEQAQRGKDYMERMVKNNYQRLRIMTPEQVARCIAEEILELEGAMLELAVSKWSRWLAEETEIRRVEEA